MDNEKKQVTYNSSITGETQVTFDIQQYMNNRAMFIGLMCNEDGYEEPFGDVTVNLSVAAPNYCGYLNVNDMPDIEKFITDNDLGEFTGFTQRSGFCEYPLYLFNVDKLREEICCLVLLQSLWRQQLVLQHIRQCIRNK